MIYRPSPSSFTTYSYKISTYLKSQYSRECRGRAFAFLAKYAANINFKYFFRAYEVEINSGPVRFMKDIN